MEIWNRHFECMDRPELKRIQSERLRETVERIYFNVPYYRSKMQEAGLGPEIIQGIGIKVNLVEPKTLERSEGKSKRVIDKRKY